MAQHQGIHKLAEEEANRIVADMIHKDPGQIVNMLISNSIDAKATSIEITIDLIQQQIKVVDNGIAIACSDIEKIGKWYHSSKDLARLTSSNNNNNRKFNPTQGIITLGFLGQSLACIATVM